MARMKLLRLIALLCLVGVAPACVVQTTRQELTARDGTRLASSVAGQGDTAVLLIHCWCGNREFYAEQVCVLSDRYRVVSFDLPGHGASGRPARAWSVTGFADDVVAVADAYGLERIVLVGHSMGGPIALAAAARLRGRVIGIVGLDNLHDADRAMTAEMVEPFAAALEADFDANLRRAVASMLAPGADPALAQWISERALRTDPAAATALMRDFAALDLPGLMRGAGVPVRCINSASSPWPTNVAGNRRYCDFDAVVLDGVGHFLQLEAPARVNPLLRTTIDELAGRASAR